MTLEVCTVCLFVVTYGGEDGETFGFTPEEWSASSAALEETGGTWVPADEGEDFFSWSPCEICHAEPGTRHTVAEIRRESRVSS
jgi:hypothetical protein